MFPGKHTAEGYGVKRMKRLIELPDTTCAATITYLYNDAEIGFAMATRNIDSEDFGNMMKAVEVVTEDMAEVIVLLADCGLNVSEAARKLHYHRNTIDYRIRKIHEVTGKDPLNFYDLCDLLPIAKIVLEG